jgi:hypothetical protein
MIHGSDRYQKRPLEATTDSHGNFRISGIWGAAPCLKPEWLYTLTMVAVGYIPSFTDNERDDRLSGPLVFGTYEIKPIRFMLEILNLYEQFEDPASNDSAFTKTIRAAKTAVVHNVTPSGVFASIKNASFNFVTVKSELIPDILQEGRWRRHMAIIARDKSRGRFYAWDSFGREIALYEPNELNNLKLQSYVRKLSEIGDTAEPPAKCETKEGFVVTVSRDREKRSLLVLPPPNSGLRLESQTIELHPDITVTEIAACAGSVNSVYVVLKGQAILKLEIVRPTYATFKPQITAFVTPKGSSGSLNFDSIAVITLDWEPIRTEVGSEIVYAVASDENIYRFSSRLVPDRRVQVVK